MSTFVNKLAQASRTSRSLVCVGLDPDPSRMPAPDVAAFNKAIVDATHDVVCAYKPNLAFYEALGLPGLRALEETLAHIRHAAPGVLVLADAKRGDIASTNIYYARALFEVWDFDAATVNAYGGGDTLEPFLSYQDRGVFVWCRSSNPGASEFQDLNVATEGAPLPLYQHMAERASQWNPHGNLGLVVGATYPEQLRAVRERCPGMPLLVPGVGAQGGDLEASLKAGLDEDTPNLLINSSRGVIYASTDRKAFAEAARAAACNLRDGINRMLAQRGREWS